MSSMQNVCVRCLSLFAEKIMEIPRDNYFLAKEAIPRHPMGYLIYFRKHAQCKNTRCFFRYYPISATLSQQAASDFINTESWEIPQENTPDSEEAW